MTERQNEPSRVPPFIRPNPPQKPADAGKKGRVSIRGMLSLLMMILSIISLITLMFGWVKITLDIFNQGLVNAMAGILRMGVWSARQPHRSQIPLADDTPISDDEPHGSPPGIDQDLPATAPVRARLPAALPG